MSEKIELDEFHYHEAMDRAYCIQEMIENLLINHPVIESNDKLLKLTVRAQGLLSDLYVEIGNLN